MSNTKLPQLNAELGQLFNLIRGVSISINKFQRKKFSIESEREDALLDIMWLSSSLNNFHLLGNALIEEDAGQTWKACEMLIAQYRGYIQDETGIYVGVFSQHTEFTLDEALGVFLAIQEKMIYFFARAKSLHDRTLPHI